MKNADFGPKNREKILGIGVDFVSKKEALEKISAKITDKKISGLMQVITAYSEFFVIAQKDQDFKEIFSRAELIVPDSVAPLAAKNYRDSLTATDGIVSKFFKGLVTGINILRGQVGETVSGVWLFSSLVRLAAEKDWKIFLLGGFGKTAENLTAKLKLSYPNLKISYDSGEQTLGKGNSVKPEVLEKINNFAPDILFVAYGPVKQEKWIDQNRANLSAKVAIGVGGTFNELTGKVPAAPKVWQEMGLKWLWRLIWEPKRIRRIFNAYPVFPLMVFKEALNSKDYL